MTKPTSIHSVPFSYLTKDFGYHRKHSTLSPNHSAQIAHNVDKFTHSFLSTPITVSTSSSPPSSSPSPPSPPSHTRSLSDSPPHPAPPLPNQPASIHSPPRVPSRGQISRSLSVVAGRQLRNSLRIVGRACVGKVRGIMWLEGWGGVWWAVGGMG